MAHKQPVLIAQIMAIFSIRFIFKFQITYGGTKDSMKS